ncbi:hypothetical protein BJ928_105353 [Rhizobium sp. WW_1]|nr:hypothetical protein BJ928_105353 [Rhizobium sp. WW_1]
MRYHHKLGEVYFLSFAFLAIGAGSSLAQNTVAQQVLPIVKIQQSNCTFPSPLPISTCTSNAYVVGSDGGVSKCAASMQAAFDKAKGKWIITKPASGTCNYLFKANGAATGPFSVDLDIDAPFQSTPTSPRYNRSIWTASPTSDPTANNVTACLMYFVGGTGAMPDGTDPLSSCASFVTPPDPCCGPPKPHN